MKLDYAPPVGWTFPTVEQIAASKKGAIRIGPFGSALKKYEYSQEGIRVLGIEDVHPNRLVSDVPKYIPEAKYRQLTQYTVEEGDVLVTNMGTVGRACSVPANLPTSIISSHLIKVTLDSKVADSNYVSWMLNFCPLVVRQIRAKCQGAIMAGFNSSLLKSLRIPLPPLLEQRRIAGILDRAEALRTRRRAALAKLDSLPQAIFFQLFGDPYKNTKAWPQTRLDNICTLTNGRAFKPDEWEADGLPIIRIQNLNDPRKPFNYTRHVFPERFRVHPNDILFSWSGTPGTSFGCFRWSGSEGWLNQHIFNVRLKRSIEGEFFIRQLNLKLAELIAKAHGGVGLQHVTKRMIDETMLLLPPVELQRVFACRVSVVEKMKSAQRASLTKLDALFATLQHRAFRGEL